MPICIPETLPAYRELAAEGVMVMSEQRASRQDIRPLEIALLNLMPLKVATETQFARVIGATPLQINLTLLSMKSHRSRTTSQAHMEAFYQTVDQVQDRKFDGLLVTGAPIEHLPYEEVTYWQELLDILRWSQTHIHAVFGVCWAAMAMLRHWHGIDKHHLARKAFGCFRHDNLCPASPYLRGFSDDCVIPVSRWTEIRQSECDATGQLQTLLSSPHVGPCLIEDLSRRALYIFNHFEYDSTTLAKEYQRDRDNGTEVELPQNYFPDDDPGHPPRNRWRSHGHLLYGNWINEIYQTTPFELERIGTDNARSAISEAPVPAASGAKHESQN